MFPLGLQFHTFKPNKKIPMRLETLSLEDQKNHFFKMVGIDYQKPLTKEKKRKIRNKTKKSKH